MFENLLAMLSMAGNYEQRCVDNFENDLFTIDTAYVTDRKQPYETAVKHKEFNNDDWIILEWSDTKEEAQKTHDKWVEFFKNNDVQEIKDCYTGETFKKEGR
ncbi:MAG: hypothetical protein E7391_06350 [Ruminococcaceae bacterium]|nr:hypothetical protein [Oscillospiraceae bacterium]